MYNFETRLQYLKGIGEKRAAQFAKLGLFSVGALLRYYPIRYEDWSKITSIYEAPVGEVCCIKADVISQVTEIKTKGGSFIC